MKMAIFLAGALALIPVRPVWAESLQRTESEEQKALTPAIKKRQRAVQDINSQENRILYLSEFVSPSRTLKEWVAQANSAVIQVTGVKANPTEKGVEVFLETSQGEKLQLTNHSIGNSYIVDIPNAQLRLPNGEVFTFRSEKPIAGITEITVTNQDTNTIRVSVIGETSLPTVELFDADEALIFGIATVATSPPSQQQTTQPESQAPSEQPLSETQEPIELVVTGEQDRYFSPNSSAATRTDTPILDTPTSVQVIPRQVLEDQQVRGLDEALNTLSGVSVNKGENRGYFINIRGFDSVPVLVDGFRLPSTRDGGALETANLESIEILRGPAAILYGEIQPGGIVNLVTKKPLAEPFYNTQLQFGSNGLVSPQIDFSGPLTEDKRVLYRLNALYSREDGFRNFDTDTSRFFFSPVLSWQISDRTNLTVSLEYLESKQPYDTGLLAFGRGVIDVPNDRIFNEPDDVTTSTFINVGYNLEHDFSNNWKFKNAFRYINQRYDFKLAVPRQFNETTGILTRAYAERDFYYDDYSLQNSVVGKFTTGGINHTLTVGLDLNRSIFDGATYVDRRTPLRLNVFNPQYGLFPRPDRDRLSVSSVIDTKTERLGIYLHDQIKFSDSFILVGGLRYDTINYDDNVLDATDDNDAFSPQVGIIYKPLKTVSLYGSYSRSFTPQYFSRDSQGNILPPERGEGYEVGVKTEWLNGRLFASLAYFDITRENVATPDLNSPGLGFVVATGQQRSRGLELDLRGEITPGWNLFASYSYIGDAEVTEDNNAALVGNRLAGTPRHSAALWTTYEISSGSLEGLGFGLGVNFVGEREGDITNTFKLDSYFLTNAAIFYRRDNWRFSLNFKNIFDVDYIQGQAFQRLANITPGQPFTVVGSISVQF
ncbi:MAG: TonB-dependent siderophore receptor [Goleter apudmare HA4340-LM2]|jgi:iron complex outermembrane receptor protein|nr:TonB-dependent siderophore receptor [Goleter apudmare HA4340-LM2]